MSISSTTLRFADPDTAAKYPLPCTTDAIRFERTAATDSAAADSQRAWQAVIQLPEVPKDYLVLPSYSALTSNDYTFAFSLSSADRKAVELPCVPSLKPKTSAEKPTRVAHAVAPTNPGAAAGNGTTDASTHIDYFATLAPSASLKLTLRTSERPTRYLLTLSLRPLELPAQALPGETSTAASSYGLADPGTIYSQRLGPPNIRGGICSPTSMAMVLADLAGAAPTPEWLDLVRECRDPATGIYGVWPLNIHTASRAGYLGAVEAFTDFTAVEQVLQAKLPMVASIRYASEELTNAPQSSSSGHLVVVRGIADNRVLVSDPAANTLAAVSRFYDLKQFRAAWLRHRGAGYIFLPRATLATQQNTDPVTADTSSLAANL